MTATENQMISDIMRKSKPKQAGNEKEKKKRTIERKKKKEKKSKAY